MVQVIVSTTKRSGGGNLGGINGTCSRPRRWHVVDIADYWIALISIDSRKTATLITNGGEKVGVSSDHETEIAPTSGSN